MDKSKLLLQDALGELKEPRSEDIAIIGMAGRFPGANSVDEYWDNLLQGVESIKKLSDEELINAGVPRRYLDDPDYVKVCPVLDDIDKFDASFFGISPRDASVMDPAHRFFLEVCWQALEHSGNTGLPQDGAVGVFAGSGAPLYWMSNVRSHQEIVGLMGEFLVRHTGNDMNFLATRASYDLDLRGPSVNIQTACSSALVAMHLARQSLLAGECDMALVGASTILVPMGHGYHYKEGEILSPDGHCRPFDHKSAGTVFGSGTGCLVLKRLDDALDNGDTVHAVLKGSAINNDGAVKVGFLAPGVDGQVSVIKSALKSAKVEARSIGYVEAHGTGTSVGDPIELTALEQAFSESTEDKQFCAIGSVKSNIGHLGEAAAAAALIKVVLALKHGKIPATLGYERANARFDMDNSPFYVNSKLKTWSDTKPLRAGITALGAGGTNCHLILEEPPTTLPGDGGRDRHLLLLSAKTKTALQEMSLNLASHLQNESTTELADAAFTLAMGRRSLSHRKVIVAKDRAEAVSLLAGSSPNKSSVSVSDLSDPPVVFIFPGGGAQYARMCVDLYENELVYRKSIDECFAIIDRELDSDLRPTLFAAPEDADSATLRLQRPSYSLPTLFAVEISLARLFESYGIQPVAYIGHSMGEYVAACLAGVFSIRDGLRLVHARGQLFEKTVKGKMIGLSLAEKDARSLMPSELSIAAVNAPDLCVASGPSDLIDQFSEELTRRNLDWTPIRIDVAAHSSLLDPILEEFRQFCRTIHFKDPQKPVVSNYTGQWLTPAEATDPEYWVKHLRGTVRFSDCVETVLEGGNKVFLEIGPGRTLTTLVSAQKTKVRHAINSVRHPKEEANDAEYALLTLGKVWAAGAHVDWTAFYDNQIRNRVPLPGYPFEGKSYWLDPVALRPENSREPEKLDDVDRWFSAVNWEQSPLVAPPSRTNRWLFFLHDSELGHQLDEVLGALVPEVPDVILVLPGPGLRQIHKNQFEIQLGVVDQYRELLELLKSEGRAPEHVVMFASFPLPSGEKGVTGPQWIQRLFRKTTSSEPTTDELLNLFYFSPVHLGQAMSQTLDAAKLSIVTEHAYCVRDEEINPWASLAHGPAQVIPRELPEFPTRHIDITPIRANDPARFSGVPQLARELLSDQTTSPVVLRAPSRWTRQLRATAVPNHEMDSNWLSDGDVVLITGGLGGIGLVLAEHLVRSRKIRLALLSREGLPSRDTWESLQFSAERSVQTQNRIAKILALESLGAQILPVRGDVTDTDSLDNALNEIRSTFGPINVVVHAAGIINDEPLQTKTDDAMRRVLSAKVSGTQNLDALITEDLKIFVLMSSVASFLGLPGQIDYTAANAFLDAFAIQRQRQKAGRTLAINWNAWRDVGMVSDTQTNQSTSLLPPGRTTHPWLDASEPTLNGKKYYTDFGFSSHWLLGEHQIKGGEAVIPGTGYLELTRAAFADFKSTTPLHTGYDGPLELRQVAFLKPFRVTSHQIHRLQILVEPTHDTTNITISSAVTGEVHMTAEISISAETAGQIVPADLFARYTQIEPTRNGYLDQDFVQFGPRWQNLEEIRIGQGNAVIRLTLKEDFVGDLPTLACHPALLDMATGAAQVLIPGFKKGIDFFVPFGYDRVTIYAPLTAHLISLVSLQAETTSNLAVFDIRIFDVQGSELISVTGFSMRKVDSSAEIVQKTSPVGQQGHEKPNTALLALLRDAITKEEGVVAFDRALAQTELCQIVVSSVDVNAWAGKLAREAQRLGGEGIVEADAGFSRPTLNTDYIQPEGELEKALAVMWAKLLGIAEIGALDDFFELGGNSLVAVRFFARVKKELGVTLPLSILFQAPNIRDLADGIRNQGYVETIASSKTSQNTVDRIETTEKPAATLTSPQSSLTPPLLIRPGVGKLPVFFVHDGLGEVLLYRSLALQLKEGHAIFGLEPEVSGGRFIHTTIVDMARAKIERIRSVQPSGPYLLAGLCAGGVVAYEIARQLQDEGAQTVFVGIIDAADVAAKERRFRITRERVSRALNSLRATKGRPLGATLKSGGRLLFSKAINTVRYEIDARLQKRRDSEKVSQFRHLDSSNTAAQPDDIAFLKLYEYAHREHEIQGLFRGGNVALFRATHGNGEAGDIPFQEVYEDPLLGWQNRVAEPIKAINVPGGHSSALQEPHVSVLARELQNEIDRALKSAGI